MWVDIGSIGSFAAFWVGITLAGYWGVTRVSKMRAEKRGGDLEAQAQVPSDRRRGVGTVRPARGSGQASLNVGNPVAGQSARDGFTRFRHLSAFRPHPR